MRVMYSDAAMQAQTVIYVTADGAGPVSVQRESR